MKDSIRKILERLSSIDPSKRLKRHEIIIFAAIEFLLLFVFLRACVGSNFTIISSEKQKLDNLKKERGSYEMILGVEKMPRSHGQKLSDEIIAKFEQYAHRISADPDSYLMREFSNPTLLQDVTLEGVSFDGFKQDGVIMKQPFVMNLMGSYFSVEKYVERLEGLPLLLIIDKIDISSLEDTKGKVGAVVSGMVYGWK